MIQQFYFWIYIQKYFENRTSRDICTSMLIFAALFTIAQRWTQPKCPLTDGQINKM
jgi:hypothetical protein